MLHDKLCKASNISVTKALAVLQRNLFYIIQCLLVWVTMMNYRVQDFQLSINLSRYKCFNSVRVSFLSRAFLGNLTLLPSFLGRLWLAPRGFTFLPRQSLQPDFLLETHDNNKSLMIIQFECRKFILMLSQISFWSSQQSLLLWHLFDQFDRHWLLISYQAPHPNQMRNHQVFLFKLQTTC